MGGAVMKSDIDSDIEVRAMLLDLKERFDKLNEVIKTSQHTKKFTKKCAEIAGDIDELFSK